MQHKLSQRFRIRKTWTGYLSTFRLDVKFSLKRKTILYKQWFTNFSASNSQEQFVDLKLS